jgi:hypothetical protein
MKGAINILRASAEVRFGGRCPIKPRDTGNVPASKLTFHPQAGLAGLLFIAAARLIVGSASARRSERHASHGYFRRRKSEANNIENRKSGSISITG